MMDDLIGVICSSLPKASYSTTERAVKPFILFLGISCLILYLGYPCGDRLVVPSLNSPGHCLVDIRKAIYHRVILADSPGDPTYFACKAFVFIALGPSLLCALPHHHHSAKFRSLHSATLHNVLVAFTIIHLIR